jgi:hypothetical protein
MGKEGIAVIGYSQFAHNGSLFSSFSQSYNMRRMPWEIAKLHKNTKAWRSLSK